MLSDAEQHRLTEIEHGLRSEDPEFTERFDQVALRWPQEFRGMTARGWLLAAVLVMGFAVLMGSGGMALIALSVAAVSAGMWLNRYRRPSDGRKPPRS
jgi:hypothetical protein